MIKKWSYVAAMMLTASCGCLFTGCIDNDEPYGITQIRVATANLLEAKKAAVEAEAAAANAQVEIAKIEAEVKKAELEVAKIKAEAEAKVQEAIAEAQLLQAKAEAAKTEAEAQALLAQAEIAKAQAEAIRSQAIADANYRQAEIDALIAKTEAWTKAAEQKLAEAQYEFEQMKIKNAAEANDKLYAALESAYNAYLIQLKSYNDANYEYMMAQHEYSKMLTDLKWNDATGEFESPNYSQKEVLEQTIVKYEASIAGEQSTIAAWNDVISRVDGIKASELYTLLEDYKAKQEANTEAVQKNNIAKEELYLNNKALYDSRMTLAEQISAKWEEAIEIPAYTFEPDAALAKVPGFESPIEIVPGNMYFNLVHGTNSPDYVTAKSNYEKAISGLLNTLLDENDQAWTQARINEMTRQLDSKQGIYNTDKANWEIAKEAYNMGNVPDASVLPYAEEIQAAVDTYNNSAAAFAALRQSYIDASNELDEAWDAYKEARDAFNGDPTTVQAKYDAAVVACEEAKNNAEELWNNERMAAADAYNTTVDNADKALENANRAEFRAQEEYNLALRQNGYDPDAAAVKTALEAYEAAQKVKEDTQKATNAAKTKASEDLTKAYNAADMKKLQSLHAADAALDKADAEYVAANGGDISKDPAYAPVAEANQKYQEALTKYREASTAASSSDEKNNVWSAYWALRNAAYSQQNQIEEMANGTWDISEIENLQNALDNYLFNSSNDNVDFPTAEIPALLEDQKSKKYTNVYNLLVATSRLAYGALGSSYDPNNGEWEVDEAFLIDVDKNVIDSYLKAQYPDMKEYQYYTQYKALFGSFGEVLYLENRIDVANAYLANNSLITDAVKPLQEHLQALEDLYTSAEEELQSLREQWADVNKQITELNAELDKEGIALSWDGQNIANVISAINTAIAAIENPVSTPGGDQMVSGDVSSALKKLVEDANDEIAGANKRIEDLNLLLDKAKYQLDQYNNGYSDLDNPYLYAVEYYKAIAEGAKVKLDFLKANVDALQAKYDAAIAE